MKHEWFDVLEYIVDEIWNIATNHHRSCGLAPYIQFRIEAVAHEKFYKDAAHDQLRPAVPKDPRTHHTSSPPLAVTHTHITCSGGASSSSQNSGFLKMFRGIFTMCCRTYLSMDVMEQHIHIVHRN
jgi:hypothetical protein